MIFKITALVIILILLITDYALLVIASRAEERAQRMYRKWKDQTDDIGDCVICKHVGTDKCDGCVCGTEWERRSYERSDNAPDK